MKNLTDINFKTALILFVTVLISLTACKKDKDVINHYSSRSAVIDTSKYIYTVYVDTSNKLDTFLWNFDTAGHIVKGTAVTRGGFTLDSLIYNDNNIIYYSGSYFVPSMAKFTISLVGGRPVRVTSDSDPGGLYLSYNAKGLLSNIHDSSHHKRFNYTYNSNGELIMCDNTNTLTGAPADDTVKAIVSSTSLKDKSFVLNEFIPSSSSQPINDNRLRVFWGHIMRPYLPEGCLLSYKTGIDTKSATIIKNDAVEFSTLTKAGIALKHYYKY